VLTRDEQETIAREITSTDQDYFVWSGLLGEPFLRDRILCFFDGDSVAIAGRQLGERGEDSGIASRGLTEVLAEWSDRSDVAFINYCGPKPAAPLSRERWNLIYAAGPQPWNQEVFLDLRHPVPRMYSPETRCQLRAAGRRGLVVSIEHRDFLGYEHIRLLRALAISHHFIASSASYLANVVSILRSEATVVCEARINGTLTGFTVAHEFFDHHPFLVVAAIDRGHRGTSEALHAALIDYYRARNACELGMGYAVGKGLHHYKMKWPGAFVGPSCHQFIWQRLGCGARYDDCLHWPWRLVNDAVKADVSIHDPRWLPEYHPISPGAIRAPVPDIAHVTDSSSGLSALMVVCKYFGVGPEDEEKYAVDLSLDGIGPDPDRLVSAARRYGLTVDVRCPMSVAELQCFLDELKPVILLVQAWGEEEDETPRSGYADVWEDDHYLVAIGHDGAGVYFEDPSLQGVRGYLSFGELEERWHARGPNLTKLHRFGVAMSLADAPPPAYLSRARRIM
jgi:hypothetical protein